MRLWWPFHERWIIVVSSQIYVDFILQISDGELPQITGKMYSQDQLSAYSWHISHIDNIIPVLAQSCHISRSHLVSRFRTKYSLPICGPCLDHNQDAYRVVKILVILIMCQKSLRTQRHRAVRYMIASSCNGSM